jgi:hypothetical protein
MPTPVSSTSIRTNAASCRQRKRTQPSRVYLTAFETRFLKICSTNEGSLYTASLHAFDFELEPLVGRNTREFQAQLLENGGHRKIGRLGSDRSGLELADVEQGIEQSRHGPDCLLLLRQGFDRVVIGRAPAQGAIEQFESLQRLTQIVTGGGEKAALALVGPVGALTRRSASTRAASAASRATMSSASTRLRSVTSRMAAATRVRPTSSMGLKLISTGNSVPSRRRPNRSSPTPWGVRARC